MSTTVRKSLATLQQVAPITPACPPVNITNSTLNQAEKALGYLQYRGFIGGDQLATVKSMFRGEERQFFFDKMCELAGIVGTMPETYQTDGKGGEAIAYLHYFSGGQASWWITEKDRGTPEEPGQHQAFGLADLFGDGGELGYISIAEILAHGGELDFYFTPITLAALKEKRGDR